MSNREEHGGVKRERKRWIPLIVWAVAVFSLPNVLSLSGSGPDLPNRFDKVIHFFEYLVLALLLYRALVHQIEHGRRRRMFYAVLFAALAIGALDEFTQHFIPRRNSSIMDWFADAAGIIAGTVLAAARSARAEKKRVAT